MDMTGEYRIAAPRAVVWEGLNDPETLRRSIPGCDSIERQSPTEMTAAVTAKVGPVKAKFTGRVTLSNLNPPESYTITGDGSGGAVGVASGSADVRLVEDGAATVLSYTVRANVGGKIAQLGARLIDGAARKMADDFFGRFAALMEERGAPAAAEPAAVPPIPEAPPIPPPPPVYMEPPAPPVTVTPPPPPPPHPVHVEPPAPPVNVSPPVAPPPPPVEPARPDRVLHEERLSPATAAASAAAVETPIPVASRADSERRVPEPVPPSPAGLSPVVWIAGLIVVVVLLLIWFV